MFTEHVASCTHPVKGTLLFARTDLVKGTVLATLELEDVVEALFSFDQVQRRLDEMAAAGDEPGCRELLEHTCPTGNGLFARQRPAHMNALFNHGATPNVVQRSPNGIGCALATPSR